MLEKKPGNKVRAYQFATAAAVVVALVLLVALLFVVNNRPVATENAGLPGLAADETDPAAFAKVYPRHYDSYLKNNDTAKEPSVYGGASREDHLAANPYMRVLWDGYSFAKDYKDDRGHTYALEDVKNTGRNPAKLNCMTCKSTQVPAAIKKYGDAFWSMPFKENAAQFTTSIGCPDCHDPETMELRITRPSLVEAFQRQGKDISKATRQEMRTLVCAQCHVEYYFAKDNSKVVFPWDNGTEPEQIYAYYEKMGFSDFTNARSGTEILKAQHPEYEVFTGSVHQQAGLSCADCHMPYIKEGNVKITSHWWTSPLKHLDESCTVCHREDVAYLHERVLYTQDRTKQALDRAGAALAEAVTAIAAAAAKQDVDAAKLEKARRLHREGQWYWDFISAENSMGFHNPQKSLATLTKAIDLAHQATRAALEAGGTI